MPRATALAVGANGDLWGAGPRGVWRYDGTRFTEERLPDDMPRLDKGECPGLFKVWGEGDDVWIVGGGDLAGQFHDAGLLDEILLQVGSVTLGRGKPLFPRRLTQPPLKLLGVRQVGSGFAELRYAVPHG